MGLLDRAGARLTAHPKKPKSWSSTPAASSTRPSRSPSTPSSRWPATRPQARRASSSSPAAWSSAIATRSGRAFPKSTPWSAPANWNPFSKRQALRRRAGAPSPFNILSGNGHRRDSCRERSRRPARTNTKPHNFRAEGDLREQQGRFRRDDWQGAAHLLPTYLYDESTPRFLTTPKSSAYIKIAEGCDHPCTFCVIPNLRGKFRSRRFESVVAEAQQLVARGVQEITLIGQDTTCYGEDLGIKDGLATLLDALARDRRPALAALPLRLSQPHHRPPARDHREARQHLQISRRAAAARLARMCSRRMKRGAGADIFLKTLDKVRAAVPGIALRTSFIVGFPGESLRDFEILEEFIGEAKFDWLGVFSYSDEEGSGAIRSTPKCPSAPSNRASAA